jgi:hypothetical protein
MLHALEGPVIPSLNLSPSTVLSGAILSGAAGTIVWRSATVTTRNVNAKRRVAAHTRDWL